jgi:hypothetical protein
LKVAMAFLVTRTAGLAPVMRASLSPMSSIFFLSLMEPKPLEITTLVSFGACIGFLRCRAA